MRNVYKFVIFVGVLFSLLSCNNEKTLTPEYEYGGPIPPITDGPSEAQKLCYELYKTYDLQVYYTLSGEDALRTVVGTAYNIFNGIPIEAGDEETSASFLKLMKKFYDYLPEEIARSSSKRHLLVKAGTSYDVVGRMIDEYFEILVSGGIYSIGMTEEIQKGIIYWGDMDDEIGEQLDVWKYSLCYSFLEGRVAPYYHQELPIPKEIAKISAGKYLATILFNYDFETILEAVDMENESLNMEFMLSNGFVNGDSWYSVRNDTGVEKSNEFMDLVAYATWISCTPIADRQEILDNYALVKQKYDITIAYFQKHLNMDLEAFSKKWSVATID